MDRLIRVKVDGHHLSKDHRTAGVQHEANAAKMRIEFDPSWDEYAKKITFWNADGKKPVERMLTADLLENMAENTRVYRCFIPGEAMTEAGDLTFIIDGYVDGKRQRSVSDALEVEPAPYIEQADQPADPTPTQAEQLQVQIDTMMVEMQRAMIAADEAEAHAEHAAVSEDNAARSEQGASGYADAAKKSSEEAVSAESGAKAAQKAAEAARDVAQQVVGGDFAPRKHASEHATGGSDPLTAASIGAVNKSGDTMTGSLTISKDGYPAVTLKSSSGSTSIYKNANEASDNGTNIVDANSTQARQVRLVLNANNIPIANGIALTTNETVDGVVKNNSYHVLHTGNKSLIKPEDIGAVSKAGDTMTGHLQVQSGNAPNPIRLYTEENGAGFVGTHEGGGVYKFVRFLPSNISNIETAHFVSNVSGGYKEYPLLHSGNFSDYAVSKTGDVMTGTLSFKELKDGVWTEHPFIHTGNLQLLSGLVGGSGKVKVGSYGGTGTYGGNSPNTIELDFEPDMVIVQDAGMNGTLVWGMWIRGCLMFMSYTNTYSSFVQDSGRTFKWASTASAAGQFNSSGVAYGYIAIKFG